MIQKKRFRTLTFVICLLLSIAVMTGSCGFSELLQTGKDILEEAAKTLEESDTSSETDPTSYVIDVDQGGLFEDNSQNGDDLVQLDDEFDRKVKERLSAGFSAFEDEIDLTECLEGYIIAEAEVDNLVSRLVSIFEHIYMQDPFMFHLDGSMKVAYELQSAWGQRQVIKLSVVVQRLAGFENHSKDMLKEVKNNILVQAREIVNMAGTDRADWEKMLIIHDELVRRITYDTGLDQRYNQTASALIDGISLCKGYAQAFKLVCDLMDLDSLVISGQADGIEHAWNLVLLDGVYYHVDVTHDDPVPDRGEHAPVEHRHFLRSDEVMSETHVWDKSAYPAAPEDGAHYYRQNELIVDSKDSLLQKTQQFLILTDFEDKRDKQLELLYTAQDQPSSDEFDRIFKQALDNSGINRGFSYRISVSKRVLQIIIISE